MSIELEPVIRTSLSKQIADQIESAIVDGSLKANDRLPTEEEMTQRFNVSRATIREAMKRLAAKKLIRSRRGPAGGTFINALNAAELSDNLITATTLFVSMNDISIEEISSTRKEMETLCCRLACQNRTLEDLEKLEIALVHQSDVHISAEAFCAADVNFHRTLADASHNRMLSFVMYCLIESLQPVANMLSYHFRERSVILNQHRRLIDAVQARNTNLATAIMTEQINYLERLQQDAQSAHANRHD
ncbi:FadR/GntR family transcriptional regulator [Neptuniibacter sp. CAU 1671]|uniref:FadR/GntR family transcriptional regulator n=1 Tax=Neptuniibacter sp. CAU 1671 TaxID=3032593 RepID=UPI0023DC2E94|nr:FadR/GntR family transcriptional regulator [Neptuniibacter sp. CAU 1671]MDF2182166.1 FadR/GntR family transcriptional regulator [Neptuniibacter sp. CAU 1671]